MSARVLVVDDVAANVKLLDAKLSAEYFDVVTATNGIDALAICERGEADIVLLDVMMPGTLDGYQVCQKIRQEPGLCNIPVILLTARGQQADFEMGRQAGADAYLTKPFSPLELIDTVDSQLARTVGA